MFTDKGLFHNKWSYFNVIFATFNAVCFFVYGTWYSAVIALVIAGFIWHGEHAADKILAIEEDIKRSKYHTKLLEEARVRFQAGQPMTEEFTYYQLEVLGANYSNGIIGSEEYDELVEQAMQGKVTQFGISTNMERRLTDGT